MTDPLAGIVDAVKGPTLGDNLKYAQCRQGIVTAIDLASHTCTVALSADPATIAGVNCLTSYTPAVNDNVYLLKSGTDLWAIGTMVPPGQPTLGSAAHASAAVAFTPTSSTTFTNIGGSGNFSFTKQWTGTRLLVNQALTGFASAVGGGMQTGVQIAGTDYTLAQMVFSVASNRQTLAGSRVVPAGIASGTYTIFGRVRLSQGTGTVGMNTDDYYTCSVLEIG